MLVIGSTTKYKTDKLSYKIGDKVKVELDLAITGSQGDREWWTILLELLDGSGNRLDCLNCQHCYYNPPDDLNLRTPGYASTLKPANIRALETVFVKGLKLKVKVSSSPINYAESSCPNRVTPS